MAVRENKTAQTYLLPFAWKFHACEFKWLDSEQFIMKSDIMWLTGVVVFQGLRSIGFYGSGFAEYPGVSLDGDDGDLSISFRTEEPNALLLLSKSINGDVSCRCVIIETN